MPLLPEVWINYRANVQLRLRLFIKEGTWHERMVQYGVCAGGARSGSSPRSWQADWDSPSMVNYWVVKALINLTLFFGVAGGGGRRLS